LFQVEYAKEAVKKGTTSVGITFMDGVVLATVKPTTELVVPESIEKIFQVDDHIGVVAAGYLADARVLMDLARVKAQVNRITYEEPINVWNLAKTVGNRMQVSTLYAGLRPFGVAFLIGGVDTTGTHLIEADPSGMLYEWKAYSIGKGSTLANKMLRKQWKESLKELDALKMAKNILMKSEKDISVEALDIAVVKQKHFKSLSGEELKKL